LAPQGLSPFLEVEDRHGKPGRPSVPKEICELIRMMSRENPLWGAPRIYGELLKLCTEIGETSVSQYMATAGDPPSQTWKTFLENHVKSMVPVSGLLGRADDPVPDPVCVSGAGA
jgi:hypothetical protein